MEIIDFNVEFIVRTKDILLKYNGDFENTNLINCTLGLLILPYENVKESEHEFWDRDLSAVSELQFLRIRRFEPIQGLKKGVIKCYPKSLKVFLQKVRNGIAHRQIQAMNDDGKFAGICVYNYHGEHKDLEVEFPHDDLRKFALFIADAFLQFAKEQ